MMELDQCKLFIGGISWETNEDRLKEYFGAYGEVVEAVIMRDRTTGRARGFGFLVFADSTVAERVVKEKHLIDGRSVEAKKAVPRDDQQLITRNNGSIQGSPGNGRTRKVFVGGLASSVTENDFRNYFNQFGTITDVVVMYDHITQRPRGFGFISFDSEDSVDRVLHRTFHELNGKMVEVKRAVPREMSPGSSRSPLVSNNYGFSRTNNLQNSSLGGFGVRMDSPLTTTRAGLSHLSVDPGRNVVFDEGYVRIMNPYIGSNPGRYNTPIGYNNSRGDAFLKISSRNGLELSEHGNTLNNANSSSYFGIFGSNGANWGTSSIAASLSGGSSGYGRGNIGFRGVESSYSVEAGGFGRRDGIGLTTFLSDGLTRSYEGSNGGLYRSGSTFNDPTWERLSSELSNSGSFGYGFGNFEDENVNDSEDYGTIYDIARQSSRGIAA